MKKLLDATFRIFRIVGNERFLNLWHPVAWLIGLSLLVYSVADSVWFFIRNIFIIDIPYAFLYPVGVVKDMGEGELVEEYHHQEGNTFIPPVSGKEGDIPPEGGWKFMINGKGVSEKTFSEFWQQYLAGLQKTKA